MLRKSCVVYRPDVDGLRAVAVLLVMLCHASVPYLAGGFVGVDVFFVISGFVVTMVLASDIEAGQFCFSSFYANRAKRLLPSLLLVVVSVFIFTALFNIPERLYDVVKNICYIFFFLSNQYQAKNVGYFASDADQIPLLHVWSLSVEEQFYLILPLVLAFFLIKRPRFLIGLGGAVFASSLMWSVYVLQRDPSAGYYSFFGRVFEFIPGVVLALYERKFSSVRRGWWADIGCLISMFAIFFGVVAFDKTSIFPGVTALLPVSAGALLIFFSRRALVVNRVLEQPVLVHLGRLSYCLYLWHWPVLYFFRYLHVDGWLLVLYSISASYILALLTHIFVEQPLRIWDVSWKTAVKTFLIAPAFVSLFILVLAKYTDNLSFIYPEGMVRMYQVAKANVWDEPRAEQCWGQMDVTDARLCMLGAHAAEKKGFLWGDSHAYQMIYFMDQLGKDRGLSIQDATYSMCPPLMKMSDQPGAPLLRANDLACAKRNEKIIKYLLERRDIDIVFMSGAWSAYNNTSSDIISGHGFSKGEFAAKLEQTVAILVSAGKQVVLFNDIPYMPKEYINCNLYNNLHISSYKECSFPISQSEAGYQQYMPILKEMQEKYRQVSIIDTYHAPCTGGVCHLSWKGMPIYKNGDYGHLNLYGSRVLYQIYKDRQRELQVSDNQATRAASDQISNKG